MKTQFHPWQLLLLILAGWINRRQRDAIEYLLTENRVLREKLGKKRILLDDDQRWRLAVQGKILGRKMLEELATRRGDFSGLTANPDKGWMLQVGKDVTDVEEGFLRGKKYLLMDRDARFSEAFRMTRGQGGVEAVRLPPRSPNLAAHIEPIMRSVKEECLGRMVYLGERALQSATIFHLEQFHSERNHQGIGNRLIGSGEEAGRKKGEIVCRERLGGPPRYYCRQAA